MATLTTDEITKFSAEQLLQIQRASPERLDTLLGLKNSDGTVKKAGDTGEDGTKLTAKAITDIRNACVDKLRQKGVKALRCTVNIEGQKNGLLVFTGDNDYTTLEKELIQTGYKFNKGRKLEVEGPAIIDEYDKQINDGIDSVVAKAIIRNR